MSLTGLFVSVFANSYAFVYKWGYIGIFIASLMGSASLFIFPFPTSTLPFVFGGVLNPFLIGVLAAFGGAIGEFTGYLLGLGGKELLEKKYSEQLKKAKRMFERYGSFFWIIIVVITPFPTDIAGIFCGIVKYDLKKFFLAVFIGKLIFALTLAYAGHYSIEWIRDFFKISLSVN